jgi:ATP-dependent Clp protease adapter protein ClpS
LQNFSDTISLKTFSAHEFARKYLEDTLAEIKKVSTVSEDNIIANFAEKWTLFYIGESLAKIKRRLKVHLRNEVVLDICEKIFDDQDTIYRCLECERDTTCVLCSLCFDNSEHKNHSFRVYKSVGGGCCDCGDEDAWKLYSNCTLHSKKYTKTLRSNINDEISDTVVDFLLDSVRFVCYYLGFNIKFLSELKILTSDALISAKQNSHKAESSANSTITDSKEVREVKTRSKSKLESFNFAGLFSHEDNDDLFCVIVYNDEVHSFTEVIEAFQVVGCSYEDADSLANEVDRKGRAMVFLGPMFECEVKKNLLNKYELRVVIINTVIVCYQLAAASLANMLLDLSETSITVQTFINYLLMNNVPELGSSPLELFIKGDLTVTHWWKVLRVRFSKLYMKGLMMDDSFRLSLATIYCCNYRMLSAIEGDELPQEESISSISVQLFTTSSVVKKLANKKLIPDVFMNTIGDLVHKYSDTETIDCTRSLPYYMHVSEIIRDLDHVSHYILSDRYDSFIEKFLKCMTFFEMMDPYTLKKGEHMHYGSLSFRHALIVYKV